MALVVEDGTGVAGAEAYATVAFADAYVAAFLADASGVAPVSWTGKSESQKEIALRVGAQYLETTFGPSYKGQPVTATQGLHFPAKFVTLPSGLTAPIDEVPLLIQRANVEAAAAFAAGSNLFVGEVDASVAGGDLTGETIKVDTITVSETYSEGSVGTVTKKTFGKIQSLVAPYVTNGWSLAR